MTVAEELLQAANALLHRSQTEALFREGDPYYADPHELSAFERTMTPEFGIAIADILAFAYDAHNADVSLRIDDFANRLLPLARRIMEASK